MYLLKAGEQLKFKVFMFDVFIHVLQKHFIKVITMHFVK